jgi:fatty acid desaturase
MAPDRGPAEWPTLFLILGCYLAWGIAVLALPSVWLPLAVLVAGIASALHSSLQHEAIHGHPFRDARLDAALVAPALGLLIPFGRFRDQHLAHHMDSRLTDPYDDPESNYLDPAVWARLPRAVRAILRVNNTLAGRMLIGPLVAQAIFMLGDARAIARGEAGVLRAWAWHLPAAAAVLAVVALSPMPVWAYLVAAYLGHAILKIRTFLEHQAHEHAAGRTVIIEDRGPLALIFLNNNLHVVHHMHPNVPWYRLPALYLANRARYVARNGGYVYRSYAEIFRRHLWRAKDPVPHPLWQGGPSPATAPDAAAPERRSAA